MIDIKLTPSEEFKNSNRLSNLTQVFAILALLFLIFYFLFILFSPAIQKFYSPPDKNLLTPWNWQFLTETDGIELEVMFIGTLVYLFSAYLAVINFKYLTWFANRIVQILLFATLAIIILLTRPEPITGFIPDFGTNILITILTAVFLFLGYLWIFYSPKISWLLRFLVIILLWFIFGIFFLSTIKLVSPDDYNSFIGPALKLLQGEKLGSFYIQYNLAGVYLFKYLMGLGFKLHQMQSVLGVIFVLWFSLYYFLASKFLKDRYLIFLFMISLIVVRFLALFHDPVRLPQVTPIRIELWVPLLLITYKFGLVSPLTAISFSAGYLLDNFFGFMYLLIYLIMIGFISLARIITKWSSTFYKLFILLTPVVISFAFQFFFFGTFISSAAQGFRDFRLGFIPTSPHSMFWVFFFILPVYLFLTLKEEDFPLFKIRLFLLGLTVFQLIYFFGRSHEHNLLNISGILLLVLFSCFDRLIKIYSLKNVAYITASLVVMLSSLIFAAQIKDKFQTAAKHIFAGKLIDINPIDQQIDRLPGIFSIYPPDQKIYVLNGFDGYINYRYNLRQVGYVSYYGGYDYTEELFHFLKKLSDEGYKIIFWPNDPIVNMPALARNPLLKNLGLEFGFVNRGNFYELKLIEINKSEN